MAQKVKQTKTTVKKPAVKPPPAAKHVAATGKPAPVGKTASVQAGGKARDAAARNALAGKAAPGKAAPGKPVAGKLAPGAAAGASADAARAKLPSVAERARQATAAARAAAAKAGPKPVADKKPKARMKSPYSRKALAPLKQKLLDLRARLAGDIDSMGKEALRADEPEVDAENVADYGSDAFERTITLELMENEARTLRLINEAFEAMEAGVFGVCAVCGEAIPLARLEALPFASNCVKCQAAAERLL
jgi:DnaK suppressor protein